MAILIANDGDKIVNTIAERDAIIKKFDGMEVTVKDAIADLMVGGGRAGYQWDTGAQVWKLVWKHNKDDLVFVTENLPISNGLVTLTNSPQSALVWDSFVTDAAGNMLVKLSNPTVTGKSVSLGSAEYNGETLWVSYAYGKIQAAVSATAITKVTSTDNALVRFDGTTGDVQDSLVNVDDLGTMRIGQKTIFSTYFPFSEAGVSTVYHELFRVATISGVSETSGRFTVAIETGSSYLVSASFEWTSNHPGLVSLTQTSASNYGGWSFKIAADVASSGSVIFSVLFGKTAGQSVANVALSGESYIGNVTISSLEYRTTPVTGYTRYVDRDYIPGFSPVANNGAFLNTLLVGKTTDDGINKLQVEGGVSVNGNVGIGTTSPAKKLVVQGSTADRTVEVIDNSSNDAAIMLQLSGVQEFTLGVDRTDSSFKISDGGALGTNDRLVLNSSGNVGIGKTPDDGINKLQVEGNISATSIKSELTPKGSVPTVIGNITFTAVSNTALQVSLKGSDGVVRSATLTLA